jgi:hypothetical protein
LFFPECALKRARSYVVAGNEQQMIVQTVLPLFPIAARPRPIRIGWNAIAWLTPPPRPEYFHALACIVQIAWKFDRLSSFSSERVKGCLISRKHLVLRAKL